MKLTNNLVPIINKDQFDQVATEFLKKYCPEALKSPIIVPIEKIARESMGLIVERVSITEDLSELGKIFFTDGITEVYIKESDEYIRKMVRKGTVFIDIDVIEKRNCGCERFTLAHECVHWEKHKMYHLLQTCVSKNIAVAHRCPDKTVTEKTARTEEDWMEWQADGIAASILMPRETFKKKADEIVSKLRKIKISNGSIISELLIKEISTYFNVSEQAAKIRLSELKYDIQER